MIKFRYKRKEPNDGGTAIQKQKIEGLRDRELLPPKDMMAVGSLPRHNTLPRLKTRRGSPELVPLSQTTIALFRVSI